MGGTPVWLASLSRRGRSGPKPIATPLWSAATIQESAGLLRRVLDPAGDPTRERLFRMNVTLCLHRACTPEEVASLPAWFHDAPPIDLAGGPVEILEETEPGLPTTRPCLNPVHIPLYPNDTLLWLPGPCGTCPPCRARQALTEGRERAAGMLAR
jgi:hypothetical protein